MMFFFFEKESRYEARISFLAILRRTGYPIHGRDARVFALLPAQVLGIGVRTLHRWLQDAGFKGAYLAARREIVTHTTGALQGVRGFTSEVAATVGGENVRVLGAVAQGQFVGLDKINIGPLPRTLTGRGEVNMVLTVDGKPANTVKVNVR